MLLTNATLNFLERVTAIFFGDQCIKAQHESQRAIDKFLVQLHFYFCYTPELPFCFNVDSNWWRLTFLETRSANSSFLS